MKLNMFKLIFLTFTVFSININLAFSEERRITNSDRKTVVVVKPKPKRHIAKRSKVIVVVPRKRTYKNIRIFRRFGHSYSGYGRFLVDDSAWKWLAFTAISLKLLDNIDEQAQREHEQAQISATTAPVGKTITWNTDTAKGQVVATKEGTNESGQLCREYQQTITVGGSTEQAFGVACLKSDGSWEISK